MSVGDNSRRLSAYEPRVDTFPASRSVLPATSVCDRLEGSLLKTTGSNLGQTTVVLVLMALVSAAVLGCGDNLPTAQEKLRSADSPLIRAAAAERLGEIGGDEAIRSLTLHGLRDVSPTVRVASVRALKGKKHPQVIDLLGDLLHDADASVQEAAARTLAHARSDKARRYLEIGYTRSDSAGRAILAGSLIAAGSSPRRIVEEMSERRLQRNLAALDSGSQAERIGALHELGRHGRPEALTAVLESLGHPSIPVSAAAAAGIGQAKDRSHVEALLQTLEEPHPTLRTAVLQALGQLGDPSAAEAMASLALEESEAVALTAIQALTELDRDEETMESLCRVALQSKAASIVDSAARALLGSEEVSSCDLSSRISEELEDNGDPRIAAILLKRSGESSLGDAERDALRLLLSHEDPLVRTAALEAAAGVGMTESGDEVLDALVALREKDAIARERWIDEPLPTGFGWGQDEPRRDTEDVERPRHPQLAQLGLDQSARRSPGRYEELMDRVADYRAEIEAQRRSEQGLEEISSEDLRARHRESLFSEAAATRATLLPRAAPSQARLLCSLALAAVPLAGDDSLVEVGKLLDHPGVEVRRAAVEALASSDSKESTKMLLESIREDQPGAVLSAIAEALAGRGAGVEEMIAAMRWAETDALRGFVSALAKIGDERATEPLIDLLDGPLATEAVSALLLVGGEEAAEALMEHFEQVDPPGAVRVLEDPIEELTESDLAPIARRSLHSEWPELRAAGVSYLRRIGAEDPWMKALRADFDSRVRAAAGAGNEG